MKRGEIWLVGLDPTQGHEQKGRRPVLIVSPEAFNRVTKVPVAESGTGPIFYFSLRPLACPGLRLSDP
jgi:mRNA-degrading endonuclease toxin of MazEF toxin-antitoxin module